MSESVTAWQRKTKVDVGLNKQQKRNDGKRWETMGRGKIWGKERGERREEKGKKKKRKRKRRKERGKRREEKNKERSKAASGVPHTLVDDRAEVVHVRDERDVAPLAQQRVEQPAVAERVVEVAVTGRVPRRAAAAHRISGGHEVALADARVLALHERQHTHVVVLGDDCAEGVSRNVQLVIRNSQCVMCSV